MDTQTCVARLSHHAERLDTLIHLLGHPLRVDRSRERLDDLADEMYRGIRFALKRDYDAGEQGVWSKTDAVSLTALYDAYAALGAGLTTRPPRMLINAHRAHDTIVRALQDLERDAR